ncbi:alpha/beta hydrolase [Paenibacillus riograndensis]|uniref:alpha/beta hydrolase n=1 Tax=Paenibacillus riograndensis TaxID=483937 RepID=UPI000764B84D|nr:alpha/beta hydrolase [Paenibacillus riograndensis]
MQIDRGQFTNIGSHKLFRMIEGGDERYLPVVFEHGCGSSALLWSLVAPEIAKITTTIVYDRAGYGWSELGPFPRTNVRCISELYELLQIEGIKGPYILVGHSYGGLNVRLFTRKHPELVAGVVLVDSMHEDEMTDRFPEEHRKGQRFAVKIFWFLQVLSKIGILKLLAVFKIFPGFSKTIRPFPNQIQDLLWKISFQKKSMVTAYNEFLNVQDGYAKVRGSKIKDIPLIVIKSGIVNEFYPGTKEETKRIIREKLKEVANDMKNMSADGKMIEVHDSGHNIHIDNPQVVIDSIVEILKKTEKRAY